MIDTAKQYFNAAGKAIIIHMMEPSPDEGGQRRVNYDVDGEVDDDVLWMSESDFLDQFKTA